MPFNPKEQIVPMKSEVGEFFSYVIAGPGGTGKSTLLGYMAEYIKKTYGKKTLLIATLPREKRSWKYQELGSDYIDHVLIEDSDWRPDLNKFNADGFSKMMELLTWLETDESYGGIILDNGTEHAEQAWHAALAPLRVASPADISDGKSRWLPYDRLASMLDQSIKSLVSLTTAENPKYVGIAWHVQAPKEDTTETVEGTKITKTSADKGAKGVEYEGDVLPQIRGQYRRKLINQVDAMLYTEIANRRGMVDGKIQEQVEYMIQVRANPERHTKLPGPMPEVPYIPNNFATLVQVMRNEYKPVLKDSAPEVNLTFSLKKK